MTITPGPKMPLPVVSGQSLGTGASVPTAGMLIDPTLGFRRRTAAVALPLAFAFQLACNAVYAWASTSTGMSDTGAADDTLAMYAAVPAQILMVTVLALIGSALAILGLPAALRVLRPAKPRLALWAVGLMILGYTCYFGIVFSNFDTLALAAGGVEAGAALDASPVRGGAAVVFLLFVVGNLGGTLLLGLAVLLGGRRVGVPRWAGPFIMGWTIGHVINIVGGGEWFAVAGGALEVVGLWALAVAAWRIPNAVWATRG